MARLFLIAALGISQRLPSAVLLFSSKAPILCLFLREWIFLVHVWSKVYITPDEILLCLGRILLLKLSRVLLSTCLLRRVSFRPLSHFVINGCTLLFMLLLISSCHSHLLAEILLVHKCMTLYFYCWILSAVFAAVTLKDIQFLYCITMLCIDKVSQCSVINKCHYHILLSCCLNADGHSLGSPVKVCLCHAYYRNWLLSYIRIDMFYCCIFIDVMFSHSVLFSVWLYCCYFSENSYFFLTVVCI